MKAVRRFLKYTLTRSFALVITVAIGVYLAILIANMGGYVDQIRENTIREQIGLAALANPDFRNWTAEVRMEYINGLVEVERDRIGLNRPFILRSFDYLGNAMSLNLGRAEQLISDSGSANVRLIILERLPITLVLFGTAQLLNFFLAVFTALVLSRRYGSLFDRIVIALAPSSAAPAWFYGVFLILIFASILGILPFGGMVDAPIPSTTFGYVLSVLKHMVLPLMAWLLGGFFVNAYAWRTFFLIHSSEDYVELAKAKGLSSRTVERRYVLRPSMPAVITSFALILITAWTGAIITENVFNWPGLGTLYFQAINAIDTPVIIASVVIYAYLLAFTVFMLDIVYALLDPRVKLGAEGAR